MTQLKSGRISRARIQLMLRNPYLAAATARLKFREVFETWCPTMATDGFNVFINPEFVETLSEDEIIGVMAHEVMHCILGHNDRRQTRDPKMWNVAVDFATNLILSDAGILLPESALLDWQYKGMTAEDIYQRIQSEPDGSRDALHQERLGSGLCDEHLEPDDMRATWARGDDHPTEAERRRLRKTWSAELKGKLPGNVAGHNADEIEKSGEQQINWRAYIAKFFTGLRRDDYRLFPANKKHIWRNIYLPSFGSPGPDHIVVVIDTSASMDKELLGKVLTEIDAARQIAECKLTLIQCDRDIQSVQVYESWDLLAEDFSSMQFRGRGGTSFEAPFRWVAEQINKGASPPDAIIYMTDGFGRAPDRPPPYECLWVVPETGADQFGFGDVIKLTAI